MSIVRTCVTAALAVTAVLVPAGAASAKSVSVDDPGTDDVWAKTYDPETEDYVWTDAGSVVNVDAVTAKLGHTEKKLTLRVSYAELDKGSEHGLTYLAKLKIPDGRTIWWWIWYSDGKTYTSLAQTTSARVVAGRGGLKCDDLAGAIDWDKDVVTTSFPRSCVKDAAWVKFQGHASGEIPGTEGNYYDMQNSEGHAEKGWTDRIKAG